MHTEHTNDAIEQPQGSATQLQLLTFSNSMNYEQLAVWLTKHPKLVGDYQQDINKLKGIIACATRLYSLHIPLYQYTLIHSNIRCQN